MVESMIDSSYDEVDMKKLILKIKFYIMAFPLILLGEWGYVKKAKNRLDNVFEQPDKLESEVAQFVSENPEEAEMMVTALTLLGKAFSGTHE